MFVQQSLQNKLSRSLVADATYMCDTHLSYRDLKPAVS